MRYHPRRRLYRIKLVTKVPVTIPQIESSVIPGSFGKEGLSYKKRIAMYHALGNTMRRRSRPRCLGVDSWYSHNGDSRTIQKSIGPIILHRGTVNQMLTRHASSAATKITTFKGLRGSIRLDLLADVSVICSLCVLHVTMEHSESLGVLVHHGRWRSFSGSIFQLFFV